jgi:hypothetical protein
MIFFPFFSLVLFIVFCSKNKKKSVKAKVEVNVKVKKLFYRRKKNEAESHTTQLTVVKFCKISSCANVTDTDSFSLFSMVI